MPVIVSGYVPLSLDTSGLHAEPVDFEFSDRDGLLAELKRHEFAEDAYSVYGGHPPDAHVLDRRGAGWAVYRSLGGVEFDLRLFDDELDACQELPDRVVSDPMTRPEGRGTP